MDENEMNEERPPGRLKVLDALISMNLIRMNLIQLSASQCLRRAGLGPQLPGSGTNIDGGTRYLAGVVDHYAHPNQ